MLMAIYVLPIDNIATGLPFIRCTISRAPVVFILQRLDNLKISAATNTPMSANLPDWLHKGDSETDLWINALFCSLMENSSPRTNRTYPQLQRRNSAGTHVNWPPWVFSMDDSHYALKKEITSGVRGVILLIASVCVYSLEFGRTVFS